MALVLLHTTLPLNILNPVKQMMFRVIHARVFNNQLYIATSDGAYTASLSNTNKDISFSKAILHTYKTVVARPGVLDEVNHQLLMGHHNGSFVIQNNEAVQLTSGAGIWLFVPTTSIFPAKNVLTGTYAGLTMLEFAKGILQATILLKALVNRPVFGN